MTTHQRVSSTFTGRYGWDHLRREKGGNISSSKGRGEKAKLVVVGGGRPYFHLTRSKIAKRGGGRGMKDDSMLFSEKRKEESAGWKEDKGTRASSEKGYYLHMEREVNVRTFSL